MARSHFLLLLPGFFALAVAPLHAAAAEEDPNVAANAKLRTALRDSMVQLRAAQTEVATLQAEKTASDAKIKELTAKSEALAKQAAADQAESRKKLEELTLRNDDSEQQLARTNEALAKWKAGYAQAAEVAKAKEAERAKLADEKSVLQAKVRDHKAQNLELYRLAGEILKRYQEFSVGKALQAREPFTGIMRARLDTQVQDYRDKVEDLRIPPEPAKKQPAAR